MARQYDNLGDALTAVETLIGSTDLAGNIAAANAATGESDTTLTDAVQTLIDGYGGGGAAFNEDDDVRFFDYDGTGVFSCSIADANAMTEWPAAPDHSQDDIPLTFVKWNWSVEQLNALYYKADVAAFYEPTDGKTHFKLYVSATTGLDFSLRYTSRAAGTLTVDWGDGNTSDDTQTGYVSNISILHTYADYGVYDITVDSHGVAWNPGGGTGLFTNDTQRQGIVGKVVFDKKANWEWPGGQGENLLKSAFVDRVVWPPNANFSNQTEGGNLVISASGGVHAPTCGTPLIISLHPGSGSLGDTAVARSFFAKRITIPDGVTLGKYNFRRPLCVEYIRLAPNANLSSGTFGDSSGVNSDPFLRELDIPLGITSLGSLQTFPLTPNMKNIYVRPITPPSCPSTCFGSLPPDCKIHVPAESLTTYQAATNWSQWADLMVGDL